MKYFYLSFLLCLLTACERLLIGTNPSDTPEKNFELFWQSFDKYYSHFEVKNVNWDSLYVVYRFKVNATTSERELFNILSEMTHLLKDGHVNLYTPFGSSSYPYWKGAANNDPINARRYLFAQRSLNRNLSFGKITNTNLAYVAIRSFEGNLSEFSAIGRALSELGDTNGMVIDVRSNGGGNSNNGQEIAAHFISEKTLYSYARYRNGPKHSDFTDWSPAYIEPIEESVYTKPVVLLVNKRCYSSCEDFILAMKARPGTLLVGDFTGGGSGNPFFQELPNGWTYRIPIWQQVTQNFEYYEGRGIAPDHRVNISFIDSVAGKDRILEKAIELMK